MSCNLTGIEFVHLSSNTKNCHSCFARWRKNTSSIEHPKCFEPALIHHEDQLVSNNPRADLKGLAAGASSSEASESSSSDSKSFTKVSEAILAFSPLALPVA